MSTAAPKFNVVFVLGGPGAGKGTQCANIVKKFGYVHLSAGDLLRAEMKKPDSLVGKEIECHMTNGTIVPVAVTCGLLRAAMEENYEKYDKMNFLIDGFPRNQDNFEGWQKEMSEKVNLKFVLLFKCKDETCIKRCLARGQEGSGRLDDNEETLRKRINQFYTGCKPIIDHYTSENLVHTIEAEGTADEVFSKLQPLFGN